MAGQQNDGTIVTATSNKDKDDDDGDGDDGGRVPSEDETERHVSDAVAAATAGHEWDCGKLDLRGCSNAGLAIDRVTGVGHPLKNLTSLNLEFALQVTDAHVAALAEWGALRRVNLNAAQNVGDEAVKALARSCPNLTEIGLYWNVRVRTRRGKPGGGWGGMPRGLGEVRWWGSWGCGNFDRKRKRDDHLQLTSVLTPDVSCVCVCVLTSATLPPHPYAQVTDDSLAMLCDSCPALRKVNLSGCKRLTDVTARALSKLRRLAFLDVTRCAFSDAGLTSVVLSPGVSDNLAHLNLYAVSTYTDKSFACIGVLSRLTFLDVCGSQSLTDKALLEIADGCEKLTYLNLSWCNQLTDVGLCAVGERCTLLELLSVHGNRNVTSQFVSTLAAHNVGPRLKTLDVNGCVGVKEDRAALKALIPSLTTFVYHT